MEKRLCSALIPYKKENGKVFVFLQKRANDATLHPDEFSFFGGGIEAGETPEQCLKREIKEELNFEVAGYAYLGLFESTHTIRHIYTVEVGKDFESQIRINEGQFGKFFSQEDVKNETTITEVDKNILTEFFGKVHNHVDS